MDQDIPAPATEPAEQVLLPEPPPTKTPEEIRRQRLIVIGLVIGVIIFLAFIILSLFYLTQPTTNTAMIRDMMIIFVAIEFMVLGVAMVILIIQMATLINLMQNELKPMIDSTNQTVNTLRGTVVFLSENLTEPVITLNEYGAGLVRLLQILGLVRKR
jgi:hypothetical protein